MSRVLRRPMFRIGGSVGEGIMSNVVPKRAGYQNPTGAASTQDNYSSYAPRIEEYRKLFSAAAGPGRSREDRITDLLIRGGLKTMSQRPVGGLLPTLAKSFEEPVEQYLKGQETEDAFQRQINLAATTAGITSVDAERLARLKLKAENDEAVIAQKAKELQAIGMPPGLARVMNNYEKATGSRVYPLPLQPKDPRGFSPSELTMIPPGGVFVDGKGNFFRKLDTSKVVQINPTTDEVIEVKAEPKPPTFFEKYGRKGLKKRGEELIEELNRIRKQKEISQRGE